MIDRIVFLLVDNGKQQKVREQRGEPNKACCKKIHMALGYSWDEVGEGPLSQGTIGDSLSCAKGMKKKRRV